MIGKVIKLSQGLEYYVLDEFIKEKRIFLFLIQVDNLNDIATDKCVVCEAKFNGSRLVVNDIESLEKQEEINNIFINRMKNK